MWTITWLFPSAQAAFSTQYCLWLSQIFVTMPYQVAELEPRSLENATEFVQSENISAFVKILPSF